jgi:hypothetical protein
MSRGAPLDLEGVIGFGGESCVRFVTRLPLLRSLL